MKVKILLISFLFTYPLFAQQTAIRSVIDKMFQSMYEKDTAALRTCFIPAAQLYTYAYDAKGNPRSKGESLNDFIQNVSLIGDAKFEEKLTGWQCLVDDGIASVWAPYEFFFENNFSHCGVDAIQLINVQGNWKIATLMDTRRKERCQGSEKEVMRIDSILNAWHHAATIADEAAFFGRMSEDGIYIGTDASERWLRDELAAWSKKYFERESAWAFAPLSRNVRLGPGGDIAWFDELLDTWMGTCRSTGILQLKNNDWKIVYYQLSIAVPNESIEEYRKLIGKE